MQSMRDFKHICYILSLGGGDPKKIRYFGGGSEKKWKVSNFHPSPPPLINNERFFFKKVIYDQLYKFLNDNRLLSNCQPGFRSLHSTVTALLKATDDWWLNIDNSLIKWSCFSRKKAFDSVNHSIFIEKLRHYEILGRGQWPCLWPKGCSLWSPPRVHSGTPAFPRFYQRFSKLLVVFKPHSIRR